LVGVNFVLRADNDPAAHKGESMTDIWVCANCHSINRQRDKRCYKCGTSQVEGAASMPGSGPELRMQAAIVNRQYRGYQSAWPLAVVASVLVLALAAMDVLLLVLNLAAEPLAREQITAILGGAPYDPAALAAQSRSLATPELIRSIVLVAAVIAFGAWLSRVIGNIPVLGGGEPPRTPLRAFIYTLIPVWNLIKVPGMIQDALYRVEPRAGGFFMVFAAWFGLVGSWLVSWLGSWFIAIALFKGALNAPSRSVAVQALESAIDQSFALAFVTSAMVVIGAVILVLLVARIERRCAARDAEVRAAALGPAEA
jgi:hypothetical protein